MSDNLATLLNKGNQALSSGDTLVALLQFETAHAIEQQPTIKSKLAYCLAIERRQFQQAMHLCREALEIDPGNPEHYYHLGRIYIIAGQKRRAIKTLRKGLKFKRHQGIIDELTRLGARKEVVFSSLPREHILNRSAGLLLSKLGSR
jgi:tetratricopeptide (TPR) repeat protein